jgi:hypothetical protein
MAAFLDKGMLLSYDKSQARVVCPKLNMKAERIILSFVAIFVGLIAAGVAFYLYQMTRTVPAAKSQPMTLGSQITPTPTPDNGNFLSIDSPQDESVSTQKTITISGKTAKDASLIVSTEDSDQVVKPASNGDFSLTVNIGDGSSLIHITSVFANGQETAVTRTVTYSTENF